MNGNPLIDIKGVTKSYDMGHEQVHALRGVDLIIGQNEYISIMGPSGSGKSTLMNIIGCLDTPTAGKYEFEGEQVCNVEEERAANHDASVPSSPGNRAAIRGPGAPPQAAEPYGALPGPR